jgi:hypothetical protein
MQAIASINAITAIDTTVINIGFARIQIDKTRSDTIITLGAFIAATGIVCYMQGLLGFKRMHPNPVNAGIAAPEMSYYRNVYENDHDTYRVNPMQRSRQLGIFLQYYKRPHYNWRVEIK